MSGSIVGGPTKKVQYRYNDANENTGVFIADTSAYDRTFIYDGMGRFEKLSADVTAALSSLTIGRRRDNVTPR